MSVVHSINIGHWHIVIGFWDVILILAVSVQSTVLAYLYAPKWKALVLTLPIPFTIATMAVGHRVDATNIMAMSVLLLFTHGVRILHYNLKQPIVPAIVACAVGYCLIGWEMSKALPKSSEFFWIAAVYTIAFAVVMHQFVKHREEEGHRSPCPVWLKVPIIMCVICGLVVIKAGLGGFMTMFPMVGVVAAYEARKCLWTMSRQIPIVMMTMLPLMIVSRITSPYIGIGRSLVIGWVVFLAALFPFVRGLWIPRSFNENAPRTESPGR